jgi:hypothetical protein
MPLPSVCPSPASCEERLNRVPKPLAWRDLYPYASVAIGDVSPIAPRASLDDGRLALTKNAGLRVVSSSAHLPAR